MITGKIHEEGSLIKAWKNFRYSIEKVREGYVDSFMGTAQELMDSWEGELKKALGVQLPRKYWHRRRPNPRKIFPYRNTGKQQNEIRGIVRKKITASGNFSITSFAEISVPYASYTNLGKKARKNGGKVAWEGWVDDVLYNNGRGRVPSISELFDILVTERDVMKGLYE